MIQIRYAPDLTEFVRLVFFLMDYEAIVDAAQGRNSMREAKGKKRTALIASLDALGMKVVPQRLFDKKYAAAVRAIQYRPLVRTGATACHQDYAKVEEAYRSKPRDQEYCPSAIPSWRHVLCRTRCGTELRQSAEMVPARRRYRAISSAQLNLGFMYETKG